jgi:membrane protease subunit HflK
MRKLGPPSEIGRLAAPVAHLIDLAWQRMHWWIVAMTVLYILSGITVVRSDEVAVILRWGKLVGATPALQEHGPGLLFAFPRPIDRVVRVQVKHIWEVPIGTLGGFAGEGYTLDPVFQGYALTGDQNVLQMDMVARYRVRDAAEWAFYGPKVDDILRVEVTSAMVRSLGEMAVDRVLAEDRKNLIAIATRRAQAGLDVSHSGLELSSLELTRLAPPQALASDFDAVQSAFISAETNKKEAEAYAARAIPQAQANADAAIQSAHAGADSAIALAKGEADAFKALDREYRANPVVVRERLYRDGVEKVFRDVGQVRWVPPPTGGSYRGFRITVPSSALGAPARQTSTSTPQLGEDRQ